MYRIIILFCCIATSFVQCNTQSPTSHEKTLQHVIETVIKTNVAPHIKKANPLLPPKGFFEALKQIVDKASIPNDLEQDALLAGYLVQNHIKNHPYSLYINQTIIQKMELLQGGEDSSKHLLNSIFGNVQTIMGKMWAAQQLCTFTTDTTTLTKRQDIIRYLLEHEDLLIELHKEFEILKTYESNILSFLRPTIINETIQQQFYHNILGKRFDTKESMHEFWRGLTVFQALPIAPFILIASLRSFPAKEIPTQLLQWAQENPKTTLALLYGLLIDYILYKGMQTTNAISNNIQEHLIGTAQYFEAIDNIHTLLKQKTNDTAFATIYEHIDLTSKKDFSTEFMTAYTLLKTNTFKGQASAFSRRGRILKSFKLLSETTHELEETLVALGQLDAYVGLAWHIKQTQNTPDNSFCFAQFREGKPYLEAKGFWNPSVRYHKEYVIPNDITMSHSDDQTPNVVITGPNTGGKSTILKGLFANILLAQTFGIAAAHQFIITPFTRINCYLNITDDLAAGVSLFKAEVLRAKELIEGIRGLDSDQYSFTIMDETFSGTSPKEGEEASYAFAQRLGTFDNSLCILATHFHKLIDLEANENKKYKNMHVDVIRNQDQSLTFSYKLKDGSSKMNIAMDILSEQGIL